MDGCMQRDAPNAAPDCETFNGLLNMFARLQYAPRPSILDRIADVMLEHTGKRLAAPNASTHDEKSSLHISPFLY